MMSIVLKSRRHILKGGKYEKKAIFYFVQRRCSSGSLVICFYFRPYYYSEIAIAERRGGKIEAEVFLCRWRIRLKPILTPTGRCQLCGICSRSLSSGWPSAASGRGGRTSCAGSAAAASRDRPSSPCSRKRRQPSISNRRRRLTYNKKKCNRSKAVRAITTIFRIDFFMCLLSFTVWNGSNVYTIGNFNFTIELDYFQLLCKCSYTQNCSLVYPVGKIY